MVISWIPDTSLMHPHISDSVWCLVPLANSGGYRNLIWFVNWILPEEEVCSQAVGTGRLSSRLSRESVVALVSSERFACFSLMFKKLCGTLVLQFSFCVLDTVRRITRRKSQMDSVSKAITFSDRKSFSFFQVSDGSRADFGSTLGF